MSYSIKVSHYADKCITVCFDVLANVFANANKGYMNVILRGHCWDDHALLPVSGVSSSLWSVRSTASRSTVFKLSKLSLSWLWPNSYSSCRALIYASQNSWQAEDCKLSSQLYKFHWKLIPVFSNRAVFWYTGLLIVQPVLNYARFYQTMVAPRRVDGLLCG